jgi:hypothetical protein
MLMLGNPPNGVMFCNKPLDGFRFAIGPENIDLPASPGIFPRHESWSLLGYHMCVLFLRGFRRALRAVSCAFLTKSRSRFTSRI